MSDRVYLVMGAGLIVAAYRGARGPELAGRHSRCITGTTVVPCDLLDELPEEIREDINVETWTEDEDTPVQAEIPMDQIDTDPE